MDDPPVKDEPEASRPNMPGYGLLAADEGGGLFPWSWATERLSQARTYWVASTRPDGRPHAAPVWGVWLEDRFYFSTGLQSRKARNLRANLHCVVAVQLGDESVIVEGLAALVSEPSFLRSFVEAYGPKYQWDMAGFAEPIYVVRPQVVFGFSAAAGEFTGSATRWVFDPE
jgi:nitroimidazol reductase NimA-like FMN-containing flavoprotein (pyridoxamine 5'-phosphate oxidase superfamily)